MIKDIKFILVILFTLTCIQTLSAQQTFLKKYSSNDDKAIYSIIESDDHNLIICGVIWTDPERTESIGTMMKIGMNGVVIDSSNYNFESGKSHFSELINPIMSSGFYFLLGSQDSIGVDYYYNTIFIHTIDSNLNIVESRNFGMWPDTINSPWDFEILGDTTAYILSFFETSNSSLPNYSIIKAPLSDGDFVYFTGDDSTAKAVSSINIDGINQLIKVNYKTFGAFYPFNAIANFNYDLSNIDVVMPDNEFFSQTLMTKMNDSSYFLSGNVMDSNTYQRNLGVAEYNLSDSLINMIVLPGGIDTITYPGAGKKNVLSTIEYVWVMGWYNVIPQYLPCSPSPTYVMLNKLNHNLELIEQIFYGGDGVYYPKDIIETSDHHIVVTGEFFDNKAIPFNCHFDPFILKVNSEGQIVNTENNNLPKAQEAIVVPNPGMNFLLVKLGVQHKIARINLFDMMGHLVLSEQITGDIHYIETSALPVGIFLYEIKTDNEVIGSGKWIKE